MEIQTAERLLEHSGRCDNKTFTKSTVQRDESDGRYYRYVCQKCGHEVREYIEMVEYQEDKAA